MRIEPPASVAKAACPIPAATAAAAPPLEPPDPLLWSHGLRVTPVSGLIVKGPAPNSGLVLMPRTTPPLSRARSTIGALSLTGARTGVAQGKRVSAPVVFVGGR